MNAELLWSLLLKGSLVVAVAAVIGLLLRRTSGARRHIVWLGAIGALLVLPIASVQLPNINLSTDDTPIVRPFVAPRVLRTPVKIVKEAAAAPSTAPAAPTSKPLDLTAPLATLWLVGFAGSLAWLGLGLVRVALLIRSGSPWQPHVYFKNPMRRPVRILLCPWLRIPATAGFFRPVLLLPESAPEWSEDRLRIVIAHEVAHIQRGDWLWQCLAQVACAIHFFNPLVWWATARLRAESETACDDFVIETGVEPTTYAQTLIDMAKGACFQPANVVGMARTTHVEGRLKSIIDARRQRGWVSVQGIVATLGIAGLVVVPMAVVHAVPTLLTHLTEARQHQGRKLPSIPWSPSKLVAPNVYLAQNGVAGLPNGVKVRLVGLAPSDSSDYWDLNAKPLPDAEAWQQGSPYWQGNVFHRWRHAFPREFSAFTRQFVVEIEAPDDMIASTSGQLISPKPLSEKQRLNSIFAGTDDKISSILLPKADPAYALIDLAVPHALDKIDYRFGIAGDQWTKASVTLSPLVGGQDSIHRSVAGGGNMIDDCGISLDDKPSIYYVDHNGNMVTRPLLPEGQTLDEGTARRLVLIDKEGKVMPQEENPSHDNRGHEILMPTAETFARIAKIELYTSPYQFVEFRNIPLRPNYEQEQQARLGVAVKGTAAGIAPGFTRKLAGGGTVSLNAVRKAVVDGNDWTFVGQPSWRGDGKVLALTPNPSTFRMPVKTWGKQPIYNFDLKLDGVPAGASTHIQPQGDVDKSFWLYGDYPSSNLVPTEITTAYLEKAHDATIRMGIASGPWQVVKRLPVRVTKLPATDEGRKAKPTGLELNFDPIPIIRFLDTNETEKFAAQPLGDVARRFVAVTYSGDEIPLRFMGLGLKAREYFSLPARHGEVSESYNKILASDVKEIRLETRPYEWVEFKGIPLNHR